MADRYCPVEREGKEKENGNDMSRAGQDRVEWSRRDEENRRGYASC